MKKTFFNLVANTISYTTTILVAFFLTPYLVRTVGVEAYGFYPMATNITHYMGFLTIALNSMASRFIAIEIVQKKYENARNYYASILISNLILAGVLSVPMLVIVVFANSIFNIPDALVGSVRIMFSFVFLSFLVQTVSSVFSVAVFVKNRLELRSIVEIVQAVLRVLLYILFYSFLQSSIVYVGIVTFLLTIVFLIFHYQYTKRLLPEIKINRRYFDVKFVKTILSSGIWNSVNQLGALLIVGSSIILANILLGSKASGVFSLVQTIPSFISGVTSMIASVFLPVTVKKYAENDMDGVIKNTKTAQMVLAMLVNIPIAIFIAVGERFFQLWVPNQDAGTLHILSVMTIVYALVNSVMWPLVSLNTTFNRVKIPACIMLVSGVLNVISASILVKWFHLGLYAIAFPIMIITVGYFLFFIPVYAARNLKLRLFSFYPIIMKTFIGAAVIGGVTRMLMRWIDINSWRQLILLCIIAAVLGVTSNFFLILNRESRRRFKCYIRRKCTKANKANGKPTI